MLVYRRSDDDRDAEALKQELATRLGAAPLEDPEVLLRSADLECALCDARHDSRHVAVRLTDEVADGWVARDAGARLRARELVSRLALPRRLRQTRPEGYAFYALRPERYRDMARAEAKAGQRFCVIGVRSVGTSLSAVVASELRRLGAHVKRMTTRPVGHPFARHVAWTSDERAFLEEAGTAADFIVVDEGPGMSGSTFLAVGEALAAFGVPTRRICFLSSHPCRPETLLASDAVARFSRFRLVGAEAWTPPPATFDFSGGLWRRHVDWQGQAWPACWSPHERPKYLSRDGRRLHKFAGFPPYDGATRARAEALARAKWSPPVAVAEPGFLAHEWAPGRRASVSSDREHAPPVLSAYLAFRARALACPVSSAAGVEEMARWNVSEELGVALPETFRLDVVSPAQVDGRLMPYEWVIQPSGEWLKTDSSDHADDQFYPGPVDIAWDVAGALVEWEFDERETAELCARYSAATRDPVQARLTPYLVAYLAFRIGFASFAERDGDPREQRRWRQARARYRRKLLTTLQTLPRT